MQPYRIQAKQDLTHGWSSQEDRIDLADDEAKVDYMTETLEENFSEFINNEQRHESTIYARQQEIIKYENTLAALKKAMRKTPNDALQEEIARYQRGIKAIRVDIQNERTFQTIDRAIALYAQDIITKGDNVDPDLLRACKLLVENCEQLSKTKFDNVDPCNLCEFPTLVKQYDHLSKVKSALDGMSAAMKAASRKEWKLFKLDQGDPRQRINNTLSIIKRQLNTIEQKFKLFQQEYGMQRFNDKCKQIRAGQNGQGQVFSTNPTALMSANYATPCFNNGQGVKLSPAMLAAKTPAFAALAFRSPSAIGQGYKFNPTVAATEQKQTYQTRRAMEFTLT